MTKPDTHVDLESQIKGTVLRPLAVAFSERMFDKPKDITLSEAEKITVEKPPKPIRYIGVPVLHEADEGYNQALADCEAVLQRELEELRK